MSDLIFSPVELQGIKTINFMLRSSPNIDESKIGEVQRLELSGEFSELELDNTRAICTGTLSVSLGIYEREDDELEPQVFTEMQVQGTIAVPYKEEEHDNITRWARTNLIAILYSHIRSTVDLISSTSNFGKIILPAIDPQYAASICTREDYANV